MTWFDPFGNKQVFRLNVLNAGHYHQKVFLNDVGVAVEMVSERVDQ